MNEGTGILKFIPDFSEAGQLSVALPEVPEFVWTLFSSLEILKCLNLAEDLSVCIKGASSSSSSSCFSSS